ncbi:MAG: hypothetical protein J6A35_01080 [Paludibacteraceae bacterium]|nr:hypothetical protein [Paludibacteraceae bacterium]
MQHIAPITKVVPITHTAMNLQNKIYAKRMDTDISVLMGNLSPVVTMHAESVVTVNLVALLILRLTSVIVYKCIT